jgi:hypothetical protein
MRQTPNPQHKKLLFVWDKVPAKLYSQILDRMEMLGFATYREYVRHITLTDLKKMKDEMKQ